MCMFVPDIVPYPTPSSMAGTGVDALDTISCLRDEGVDQWISFPHFVFCGQSSAKSALLKALLCLDLRQEEGMEFGVITEVSVRKSNADQPFKASLSFLTDSDTKQDAEKSLTCSGNFDSTLDTWPAVLKAFKANLSAQGASTGCDTIARLDVQGPHLSNFDFVDLPAALVANDEVMSHLVLSHLIPGRRILFAAFSDKQDPSGELIMRLLEQVDPQCIRTIFFLDCADLPIGEKVTHLSKWDLVKIHRGWHLVRKDTAKRSILKSQPAPSLPRGPAVCNLDDLLDFCNLLWSWNMQRTLPEIFLEIQNEQQICDAELAKLGPTRSTSMDQRHFLLTIHATFKALVDEGFEGRYKSEYFQTGERRRLRNMVRLLSNDFAIAMQEHGHAYHITDLMPPFREPPLSFFGDPQISLPTCITASAYIEKIHNVVFSPNQSYELPGCDGPLQIGSLFRLHSANWRNFAVSFAEKAFCITERFLCDVINDVTDYSNAARIWKSFIKPSLDRRKDMLATKIEEVMRPFIEFELWAMPVIYEERVQHWERKARDIEIPTEWRFGKDLKALKACSELLLNMLAYYMGAVEAFINNIISLAVEGCLLRNLSDVFNLEEILAASPEDLEICASDSSEVSSKRAKIQQKRDKLTHAHGVLQKLTEKDAFSSFNRITTDIEQGHLSAAIDSASQGMSGRGLRDVRIVLDEIQYELRPSDSRQSPHQDDIATKFDVPDPPPIQFRRPRDGLSNTTSSSVATSVKLHNSMLPTGNTQSVPSKKRLPSFSFNDPPNDQYKTLAPQPQATPSSSTGNPSPTTATSPKTPDPKAGENNGKAGLAQGARPVVSSSSPQGYSISNYPFRSNVSAATASPTPSNPPASAAQPSTSPARAQTPIPAAAGPFFPAPGSHTTSIAAASSSPGIPRTSHSNST